MGRLPLVSPKLATSKTAPAAETVALVIPFQIKVPPPAPSALAITGAYNPTAVANGKASSGLLITAAVAINPAIRLKHR
jgi:hypothetical protein